jgi:hypothetical protein
MAVLFVLPPHSSHLTQPLDVGIFGPLKNIYNRECSTFMQKKIWNFNYLHDFVFLRVIQKNSVCTVPPQNGDFCTVSEVGPVTTNATFSPFDKNSVHHTLTFYDYRDIMRIL